MKKPNQNKFKGLELPWYGPMKKPFKSGELQDLIDALRSDLKLKKNEERWFRNSLADVFEHCQFVRKKRGRPKLTRIEKLLRKDPVIQIAVRNVRERPKGVKEADAIYAEIKQRGLPLAKYETIRNELHRSRQ